METSDHHKNVNNVFYCKGEITGDVTKKNCTTTFHGFRQDNNDKYFFRLECARPTKYSFGNGVTINAQPGING